MKPTENQAQTVLTCTVNNGHKSAVKNEQKHQIEVHLTPEQKEIAAIILAHANELTYMPESNTRNNTWVELNRDMAAILTASLTKLYDGNITVDYNILSVDHEYVRIKATIRVITDNNIVIEYSDVGEASIEKFKENAMRTAATRALKRVIELFVGPLTPIFIGLGKLYTKLGRKPKPITHPKAPELIYLYGLDHMSYKDLVSELRK